MIITPVKLSHQHEDGSFNHYVVFSTEAPWDATDDEKVLCASEHEADKLITILRGRT